MPIVRDGTESSTPRGLDKEVVQLTASETITHSHSGRVLQVNSSGSATLTLPSDLPPGFYFEAEQVGAGQVIFSAGSGATLRNRASSDRTAGQYARVRCEVATNTTGHGAAWTLSGDVTDTGGVTSSTAAELSLLDNVVASVSFAVTAGASNICIITGTIKDAAGATIAASRPLLIYITEASTGIGITGDTYSTGAAVTTGTALIALTANKAWLINTHTNGTFAISITDTAKPVDQRLAALDFTTGQLSVSAASAALWGA